MNLYTIGFTGHSARDFFNILKNNHVKTVIDTRLNNVSQLSGFAKKKDLEFFLEIFNINYIHLKDLAPTKEILDNYKNKQISWDDYAKLYNQLLVSRKPNLSVDILDSACLLCSENKPDNCHRRLASEFLASKIKKIKIIHL